ncbi:MAG TPA: DUF1376 domain-containing protein [Vicinamibacterales bacterium]|nr:DUF1376 domain-containing protein [Vicinamibacterales bacterium]
MPRSRKEGLTLSSDELRTIDFAALPQAQEFPAMQFYAAEWLSGSGVQAMTAEQVGGFIMLLSQAWLQKPPCSLPDDEAVLASYSRLGLVRWRKASALILAQFVKCSDGRLRNPKQVTVWLDMRTLRQKRRASRFGDVVTTKDYFCNDKSVVSLTPSIEAEDTSKAEEVGSASTGVQGVPSEAADAYRPLATEWHSPGLTDRNLKRLSPKIEKITIELSQECDGFTWAELMRRARGQPFIHERISSFDFEWFLKRESQGTRLNARKVWYGQFGSSGGSGGGARRPAPEQQPDERRFKPATAADVVAGLGPSGDGT